MRRFDALVVGGGPAGSTAAWALGRAGLSVAVVDKSAFPREKPCAGWITPAVARDLELDVEDYARGRTFQPISAFRTGLVGSRGVETRYAAPVSYGILRREFDHYLLERSGAALYLGRPLASLTRAAGLWLLDGRLSAPLLIGAGGHFCPVARRLGGTPPPGSLVAAMEAEFQVDPVALSRCRLEGRRPELYFCPDLKGYGWCFLKGSTLNVGLGRAGNGALKGHLESFVAFARRAGKLPPGPIALRGHAYLLRGHASRPPVGDGVLLVGDAAGLAASQSGEGIGPAVASALLAARVVREAGGDVSARALAPYAEALAGGLARPRPAPGPLGALAARALMGSRWFARRVLIERCFLGLRDN